MSRAILGLVVALSAAAAVQEPVRIDTGLVSGIAGATPEMRIFKGIPYAAPPVGDLRWKAPQPAPHWEGVRKAEQFSPVCMQNANPNSPQRPSEDCLYLNVWTAAKSASEKRPVMVWIYGGGFTNGSASLPDYDGEKLAEKGAVVVTLNYRLGPFGFFAHPELTKESDRNASGNYGLMDSVAVLQWVQKNIAAFGGDPKRVTIFGESAGSIAVSQLMASPQAKGLFHRAIGESGAWVSLSISHLGSLADAEQAGVKAAEALGAKSLKDLRAVPADALQRGARSTGPIIDGWFLTADPTTIFEQGKQNAVPVLVGSNKDEGTFFSQPTTAERFTGQMKTRYSDSADAFFKLYPASSDEEANASQLRAFRDEAAFIMHTWARLETKTGKTKAYLYYFTHEPPVAPGSKGGRGRGATHVAEVPYVFGTQNKRPWTDADKQLSDTMSSYWVNFAATGDPNGKGLPKWAPFDETKNPAPFVLGEKPDAAGTTSTDQLAFYQSIYTKKK